MPPDTLHNMLSQCSELLSRYSCSDLLFCYSDLLSYTSVIRLSHQYSSYSTGSSVGVLYDECDRTSVIRLVWYENIFILNFLFRNFLFRNFLFRNFLFRNFLFWNFLFWNFLFWNFLFWNFLFWNFLFWNFLFWIFLFWFFLFWNFLFWNFLFWNFLFWNFLFWNFLFWNLLYITSFFLFSFYYGMPFNKHQLRPVEPISFQYHTVKCIMLQNYMYLLNKIFTYLLSNYLLIMINVFAALPSHLWRYLKIVIARRTEHCTEPLKGHSHNSVIFF